LLPVHPQSYAETSKRRKLLAEESKASEDKRQEDNIDSEGTTVENNTNSDTIS